MADHPELTGFSKYFNSVTTTGRANFAKLVYGLAGVVILYNVMKPKKKPAPTA